MTVNLSLSPEQAALLMPLLEQISTNVQTPQRSSVHRDHRLSSTIKSLRSSSPDPQPLFSHYASSSECQYSTDELLERKKKNTKSSPAQNYLLVSQSSV